MTLNALDSLLGDDLDTFLVRLNQTIQWCSRPSRGTDPETCLRTKELEPSFWLDGQQITTTEAAQIAERYHRELKYFNWEYRMWEEKRKEMVERVAANRASLLNPPILSTATSLSGGRLVVYWPDFSVAHGNTKEITKGFFTARDVPPWDTWIGVFHEKPDYLLSWVPAEFMEPVTQAVAQSFDGALGWIENDLQQEEPVYQLLKQKGLI